MSSSFTSIPILDLALAENPETRPQLLQQLGHILTDIGFLYVKNHGVPSSTIDNLITSLPPLFDLPAHAKEEVALEKSPHFLGYSKLGSERTAHQQDLREQFEFATELPDEFNREKGDPWFARLRGPNQWPSAAGASFRGIVERYTAELRRLSEFFLNLIAEALGLEEEFFFQFVSDQDRLKLVHYHDPSSPLSSNTGNDGGGSDSSLKQGVGPHKDSSGWLTFLLQASPPEVKGLQVLNKDGNWIDVPAIPGTFVVNIGQAFEAVTNGMCRATIHRVMLPSSPDQGGYHRYSVPYFQGVRSTLTKSEVRGMWDLYFKDAGKEELEEAARIDSPFLRGKYEMWGEAQLRTKIRSHRDVGKRYYPEIYEACISDD
ncbi:hypothetical protein FQN54_009260 [Arachnomyces sp. PD_36]|nr:hypothetical protein FQN54_009260 [Arachnomyces sp. PD_36]